MVVISEMLMERTNALELVKSALYQPTSAFGKANVT